MPPRLELTPVGEVSRSVWEEASAASRSPFQMPAFGAALAAAGGDIVLVRVLDGEHVLGHALLVEEESFSYRKWLGLGAPAVRSEPFRARFWSALVSGGRAVGRLAATWREAPIVRLASADLEAARAACAAMGASCAEGKLGTYVVALDGSSEGIAARFEARHRNRIRKAASEGFVVEAAGSGFVDAFCAMLDETYARSGLVAPQRPYFERLLREPWALAFLARDANGVPAAGAVVTLHEGEAVYLHGASTRSGHGGSSFLQAEIIRVLVARGATSYDLGGIALPGSPGDNARTAGIRDFKARFGGELRLVPSLQVKLDPAAYDAARSAVAARMAQR